MKINITCNDKNYTLSFTRKTARKMANGASQLSDKEDVVETAGFMIKGALQAEHPNISAEEANSVAEYVMENCRLVDDEDGNKGLLTYLNGMVSDCLPKGFTKKAEPMFTVIE